MMSNFDEGFIFDSLRLFLVFVIARSKATKQSSHWVSGLWIASRSLSSGAPFSAPLARNDGFLELALFPAVGNAHAGAHVALDTIGRDRIAQAVLRKRLHARDSLGEMRRRQRHQHLFIRHAAIAAFRIARQRQAGLAGLERPPP